MGSPVEFGHSSRSSRAATPLYQKEPVYFAQAYDLDASWVRYSGYILQGRGLGADQRHTREITSLGLLGNTSVSLWVNNRK